MPTVDELPAGAEMEDVEPAAPEPAAPAATAVEATAVEATAVEVTDTDAPDPQAAGDAAYRAAFTHAPVGMAIIELDGSIREANPAMMTLLDPLGRAPHPTKLTDLVTDDEQSDLAQRIVALGAVATTTLRVELPIIPSTAGTLGTRLSRV